MAEWCVIDEIPDDFKDGRYVILWARFCGRPTEPFASHLARFSKQWSSKAVNGEPATGWLSAIGDVAMSHGEAWLDYDDLIPTHWQLWPENGPGGVI